MMLQKEVFEAYRSEISSHPEENQAGARAMKEVIEKSPLNYNGVPRTCPLRERGQAGRSR